MKDPKVRVGSKNPTELRNVTVIGEPPGQVRVRIDGRWPDNIQDLRAIGRAIDAHALAKFLIDIVGFAQQKGAKVMPIPVDLIGKIILVLSALPGPKPGRPRLPSTNDALDAVKEGASKRKASKLVAPPSGENPENIRRRLAPSKSKPRKPKRRR